MMKKLPAVDCGCCEFADTCESRSFCVALGKPWEPADDRRSVQMNDNWWNKQSMMKDDDDNRTVQAQ